MVAFTDVCTACVHVCELGGGGGRGPDSPSPPPPPQPSPGRIEQRLFIACFKSVAYINLYQNCCSQVFTLTSGLGLGLRVKD